MIDRMVTMDCHERHRILSITWVDARKAYDTVHHKWLADCMDMHSFPYWLCKVIRQLLKNWNTQNIVRTKCGPETSRTIPFMRGSTSAAMYNIGLHWDSKRCNTIHVKRGSLGNDAATSFTIRYQWFKVLKKVQGTSSSEYAKQ